jgi:hypothetical protein
MSVFQLGIENGGARLWKKGTSKTMKKGNIVIFSYLLLKNLSALHFQLFASMHLHDSLFIYILLHMYRNAVKI